MKKDGKILKNITLTYGIKEELMEYRLWIGRRVQLWEKFSKTQKFIGVGHYKGCERYWIKGEKHPESRWIKIFQIDSGKFKGDLITEIECNWNPIKIGLDETTGLS